MTYRTILVELTTDAPLAGRLLRVARSLAARFGATLVGMHVTPVIPPIGGLSEWATYIPPEFVEAQREANSAARGRVRTAFEEVCGADQNAAWREAEGAPDRLLAAAARAADLVVAGRSENEAVSPGAGEQLVVAAGVPVLMVPWHFDADFGKTVLVGWNGSREATRAAHDALPFLREAERVVLCTAGDPAEAGLDAAAAMLRRHGVAVEAEATAGSDRVAGEVLLGRADAHGADLVVMGAYGHSRLREIVLGGATRHVLREATLPVLFGS